jgi:hypothetical protein
MPLVSSSQSLPSATAFGLAASCESGIAPDRVPIVTSPATAVAAPIQAARTSGAGWPCLAAP